MLGACRQEALERAAADPRYMALYRQACERFDAYVRPSEQHPPDKLVAYFSMEYGLVECAAHLLGRPGRAGGRFSEGRQRLR